MKLYIKYMVNLRCKLTVQSELEKLGILYKTIDLGLVETFSPIDQKTHDQLNKALLKSGLEILDNKRSILVERIKTAIVDLIYYSEEIPNVNYSDYLSDLLGYEYTHLANTFSEVKGTGTTIEDHVHMNSVKHLKKAPVPVGMVAGGVLGVLAGAGMIAVPGLGVIFLAGKFVGLVSGMAIGAFGGSIASFLISVGFKQDQVVRLEKHLEDGHYMVVINGSEEHVSQAHVLLHTHDEHEELHK